MATISVTITFDIAAKGTIVFSPVPPKGEVGVPYNYVGTLIAKDGVPPFGPFALGASALPTGLTASISGNILTVSGTPTASGQASITVSCTDSAGQ